MVTLTKALDPQSPAPYRPLGDEARVNYEKFITNINDDLYEQHNQAGRLGITG